MFNLRNKRIQHAVPEFMHANKDLLVIVCDPKTDTIYAGYKDNFVGGKIKSPSGKKLKVVKSVLKSSLFKDSIDLFITGLVETLKLPVRKGNQFLMFLDGALFNLAKATRKKTKAKAQQPIPSPYK